MRASRSPTRAAPPATAESDGMSRRGWMILVAATAAVAVLLLVVAALATGAPAGHARNATAATSHGPAPQAPPVAPRPAPLGLPPRPTPTQVATAPAQPVSSLTPGACLQVFPSRWADGYPIVDCAAPHIAQLLTRGVLGQPAGAPYPGAQALDAQVSDLCEAPGLLNWDWVAVWNEDVQIELRYPPTATQWTDGDRSYYCFVDTFSRHELTGSAAAAG